MRTASRTLLALALTLAAPAALHAQATAAAPAGSGAQGARPDFSGTYTLDPAQSDQGQMVPQKLTQKISQTGNQLVVERTQTNQMGESSATLKYALDGTASQNELKFGDNAVAVSTVVTWEGASPVFTNSLKFGDQEIKQVDRWALSDGGKKLLVTRTFNRDGQDTTLKLVLVKQ